MKGEPLGCLPADPREPGQFGDQLVDRAHRSEWRRERQRRHLAHFSLEHLGRTTLGLGYRGEHQVAQEIGVMVLKDRRINRDPPHGAAAIGGHPDHATTGRGLDGAVGQFGLQLLQPALNLLPKLKELLEICHAIW